MFIVLNPISEDTVYAIVVAEDSLPGKIPENWVLLQLAAKDLHIEAITHAGEGPLQVVHSWAEAAIELGP